MSLPSRQEGKKVSLGILAEGTWAGPQLPCNAVYGRGTFCNLGGIEYQVARGSERQPFYDLDSRILLDSLDQLCA